MLSELQKSYKILVVNDGSGPDFDSVFKEAKQYAEVHGYETNHGKGYALKTGLELIKNKSFFDYVITADADGQHKPEDIILIVNELNNNCKFVLGVRKFIGKIPFKSKFGNNITKFVFKKATGVYCSDTQTGLRGFSCDLLDWLINIEGDRYEYEMNVLLDAAFNNISFTEVPIQTIYEKGNPSSHFKVIKDSAKIYKSIFNYEKKHKKNNSASVNN